MWWETWDDLTNLEVIKLKIKNLEYEMKIAQEEYFSLKHPCGNKECMFYNTLHKSHCNQMFFVDECPDYIPSKIEKLDKENENG